MPQTSLAAIPVAFFRTSGRNEQVLDWSRGLLTDDLALAHGRMKERQA